MIVAYEAESKERENLMLQIFILSCSHVYTHEKFREVQAQFRENVNCITKLTQSALGFTTYKGILCHHSLNVLSFERVDKLTSKYILQHWSKKHNICEFASESEELTGILHCAFDNVMAEMQEYQAKSKGKCLLSHEDAILNDVNDLQSPPRVRARGRSKNRLGSNMEKKDRKCIKEKKRQL
ncbi:hypothetical protein Ahy_A06g029494 [Arachis hypogaea]|uniref:Protein FAR1-RELATED SEQUENCE n=1 Tax=Arachis hypogaea TaxID=3818 RepID=A0A445CTC3_ARAHY|nr:hypothetical protein Ahy_A06g029494 [Arachis hypogaea]